MTDQNDTQTDIQNEQPDELTLLKQRARMMGVTFSNNIRLETLRERVQAKIDGEVLETEDTEVDDDTSTDLAAEDPDRLSQEELNNEGVTATITNHETAPAPVNRIFDAPNPETVPAPPAQPIAPAAVEPTPATKPAVDTTSPEFQAALQAAVAAQRPDPFDHDGDGHPGGSRPRNAGPQAMTPPEPERKLNKAEAAAALRSKIHAESMALIRCRITNLDPKKKDLQGEIFTVANEILGTIRKYIPYGDATEQGYHIEKVLFDQLEDRKFQQIRTIKDARTGTTRPETRWVKEFSLEVLPQLTQEELNRLATAQAAAGSMEEFTG